MSQCCNKFIFDDTPDTFQMWQGLRGPYFTPHVAENGDLSWSNNGQLPNPETVNIKGPPGPGGAPGGTAGQLLAKASDEDYDTEWIDPPDLDAGHVEYDPAETYDDGSVGKELTTINSALSSLQSVTEIIDTASGAIASFPDGSGLPMRSLVAQINPVQDLHGQTSPYPAGGGPNQWDETWESGDITAETGQNIGDASMIRTVGYIPVDASKTYYFFCGSQTTGNARARFYDQNKSYIGYSPAGGTFVPLNASFTPPSGAYYMRFAMQAVYGTTYKNDISVNYPATVTSYAPYSNECPISGWTGLSGWVEDEYDPTEQPTFSVSWQTEAGTVYGGTLDVVSGLLTVEYASYTIDENQSFTNRISNQGRVYFELPSMASDYNGLTDGRCVCDKLVKKNTTNDPAQPLGITVGANSRYVYIGGVTNIPGVTDINSLKTWLGSNNITFTYKLATPQTYQLSPQQISTLLGNNTVFVDTGSVSVTYQASIKGYIDKVLGA